MNIEHLGGKEYGGWQTALDGLGPTSVVYSFGVGTDASWDLELIRRFGMPVYAYDPNPVAVSFVARNVLPNQFRFSPVGLATFDGTQRFWGRKGKISTSTVKKIGEYEELPVSTLQTLMYNNGHHHIDILKLDIEGSEFAIIPSIVHLPIRQLLVELHTRFYRDGFKGLRRLYGAYLEWRLFAALRRGRFELVARKGDDYTFHKNS